MAVRSNVVTVLSALALLASVGCGGPKGEAKTAETNPWADYKGTYATPGTAKAETSRLKAEAAAPKADAKAKEAKADKADDAAAAPAPAASTTKKASHGMIHGESVSSIGVDAFADASKSAIKSKVVSTKFLVGPQYEEMQVQMKGGASVQVIRPAANPASDGPAITSPKARSGSFAKTEAGWYDEEADVLVVVTAAKKASAQKTLGTILTK